MQQPDPPPTAAHLRFADGGIECTGLPPDLDLPPHLAIEFDPRTGSHRGHAMERGPLLRFLARSGIAVETADPPALPLGGMRGVELRDYQAAALAAWRLGGRRGMVVLPTGAGKTRVAIAAMAAEPVPTLVVVPTRALLQQWRTELSKFHDGPIGILGDGERRLCGRTIATYASARRCMPGIGDRFRFIVVDEAHHFGGAGWGEVLQMCAAEARLGLTATPPRGTGWFRLAHLLGPVRFQIEAAELAGKHLAELRLVHLLLDLDPEEQQAYDAARAAFEPTWRRFRGSAPGAPWSEFVAFCRKSTGGREALRAWHDARRIAASTRAKLEVVGALLARHRADRDDRVLVFTADRQSAYAIARRCFVMPITGDMSRGERKWALEAFRTGELRALVSPRVLNEGVDVPAANVAILVGGTQGEREFVQRVGRVLRPKKGRSALVYELTSARTAEVARSASLPRSAKVARSATVTRSERRKHSSDHAAEEPGSL